MMHNSEQNRFAYYPAKYRDRNGEENTFLTNNGFELRMRVRGIEFAGDYFGAFGVVSGQETRWHEVESLFTLDQGDLCACTLEYEMPLGAIIDGVSQQGQLKITVVFPDPENPKLDWHTLQMEFAVNGAVVTSRANHDHFEYALEEIQSLLPAGSRLQCCWGCAFSDYSPYGICMFGDLRCFRDNRAGYGAVKDKWGLFEIWGTQTESVQETYLCPEFQLRVPGTGYRG